MNDSIINGNTLILVVTHDCNLNCDYCPVEKRTGRISFEIAKKAVDVFFEETPERGRIRFFGGEPLLEFPIVQKTIDYAKEKTANNVDFDITTNGVLLDSEKIEYFILNPDVELILSIDGAPRTHLMHRRGTNSYNWLPRYENELKNIHNITVNKVVSPDTAGCLAEDFLHIVKMGFNRVNILPAYYVKWKPEQIALFRLNLDAIVKSIETFRRHGKILTIKNFSMIGDRPLFNRALVVDDDGSCFSSNIFMHRGFGSYREKLRISDIWNYKKFVVDWNNEEETLKNVLSSDILNSTFALDRELSLFLEKISFIGLA